MKVLFNRSAVHFSGVERYNVYLLKELHKYLDITFITNLELLAKELQKEKIKVRVEKWLPVEVGTKKQLLKAVLYSPIFILRYLGLMKGYDVICLQSRTEMIFLTPLFKLLKYKSVWIQNGPLFASETSKIILWLYIIASRSVDNIIAVSLDTKYDLIKGGVAKDKIVVIYSGLSLPQIFRVNHPFTVGFLGTVTKEKGIEDYVNAMNGIHVRSLIIGNGPDLAWMKKQISGTFTGFVTTVNKYLRKVDVLLLPTHHHEGISIAILESQALGIPVLTTDIGGNREIITQGVNGYLFKQGDIFSMHKYINLLIENRALLKKMGKNARATVQQKFNSTIEAKKFVRLFKSL